MPGAQSGSDRKTQSRRKNTKKKGARKSAGARSRSQRHNGKDEISDLHDGFMMELADMLHAEKQLVKALPKMANAARSEALREALEMHTEVTEEQIDRLEEVFELFEARPHTEPCEGMQGIIEEAQEILGKARAGAARDALIISACQKAEHYEIASYGSLCAWAAELGQHRAVDLLEQTLHEEKAADRKLTRIAEGRANAQASRHQGEQSWESRRGYLRGSDSDAEGLEHGRSYGGRSQRWQDDGESRSQAYREPARAARGFEDGYSGSGSRGFSERNRYRE